MCDDHDFADDYLFFRWYMDELLWDPDFIIFSRTESGISYLGLLDTTGKSQWTVRRRPLPELPSESPAQPASASAGVYADVDELIAGWWHSNSKKSTKVFS